MTAYPIIPNCENSLARNFMAFSKLKRELTDCETESVTRLTIMTSIAGAKSLSNETRRDMYGFFRKRDCVYFSNKLQKLLWKFNGVQALFYFHMTWA